MKTHRHHQRVSSRSKPRREVKTPKQLLQLSSRPSKLLPLKQSRLRRPNLRHPLSRRPLRLRSPSRNSSRILLSKRPLLLRKPMSLKFQISLRWTFVLVVSLKFGRILPVKNFTTRRWISETEKSVASLVDFKNLSQLNKCKMLCVLYYAT
jgi:hypothetical protein